jgi:uncharacterized protein
MAIDLDRLASRARAEMGERPPAHDWLHVARVAALARAIALAERADVEIAIAAATLHELVNLPKDHPDSAKSGDLCAVAADRLLASEGVEPPRRASIVACIRDHAFSKGAAPTSVEAAIVQDADRLDAIGAVGIARLFATTADMKRPFYADVDPLCRTRAPDDKLWGLDHFFRKLLKIEAGLHTATARALARPRVEILRAYLEAFAIEIGA